MTAATCQVGYTKFRYQKIFNVADLQGATDESQAELQDQIEIEMDAFKLEISTNA